MEPGPKQPKMIKIKLPKQRIMSINAASNSKAAMKLPVQKCSNIVSKESFKQRKTIVGRDDSDNNLCYFEVLHHSTGKENSNMLSPTERVYISPRIPIKHENGKPENNSSEIQTLRVYTDSHKKMIKSVNDRIEMRNPSKIKEEHMVPIACDIDYVIQNEHEIKNKKNEEDIQDDYEMQNDEHDTQYEFETKAETDIANAQKILEDYKINKAYKQHEDYVIKIAEQTKTKIEPTTPEQDVSSQDFEETMETYFISNKKTDEVFVVKNENNNVITNHSSTLDSTVNNTNAYETTVIPENTQISEQNLFQIVTENGTLLLQNNAVIQELIKNGQLILNNEEQGQTQEVVLCDGEHMDGTEYVLEYADEDKTTEQETIETISCNSCGKEFHNLNEFELHQYIHKDEESSVTLLPPPETYLCYCGQNFEDINEFETHQNKHKTNFKIPVTQYSQKFKCNLCSKIYITQSLLDNHMISHETKSEKKKVGYRREKPATEPLSCDICSKVFKYKSALRIHKRRHTDGKKYECEICKKRFSQRISLRKHKFIHINPVTCSHCDIIFRDKDVFEFHKVEGVCPMESSRELIQRWTQEAITENNVLGYVCMVCDTFFNTNDELETHILTSHMLDSSSLFCFECGERASSKEELQAHLVTHVQVYTKKIACETCGIVCESQASLTVHQRVHTNERPFQCSLCPLTFKTKIHMQSHQLVHTKEKNFACPVCSKCFALKGNMQAHLRGHTGEKPYVCMLCKEAFKDTKILKKHKLMFHPDDETPWEQYLKVSKTRPAHLALSRANE